MKKIRMIIQDTIKVLTPIKKIMELHKKAIENNEDTYIDPETGFKVFTAKYLLAKEQCCGSGCRHCPY